MSWIQVLVICAAILIGAQTIANAISEVKK